MCRKQHYPDGNAFNSPTTVTTRDIVKPSFLPITSMIRARGSFETPATTVDTMLVVATRPWEPKLLVTYGKSDEEACCWSESVK